MTDTLDLWRAQRPAERADEPAPPTGPESIGRIVGLDAARALAVFGMYYSHVGPWGGDGGFQSFLMDLPHGRSSALFATLAGLSLVLIAGGNRPKTGRSMRQAVVKIAIRAVLLLILGTALTAAGTSIVVILAFYGLYFLLALPFIKLRARTLAILAVVVAIGGPLLIQFLWTLDPTWIESVNGGDPLSLTGGDGITALLFNGTYPAVSWMAYIFAGMALGKIDLGAKLVQIRLAIIGPVLGLIGYGGSWLAQRMFTTPSAVDQEWKALDKSYSRALEGQDWESWGDAEWKSWSAEHSGLIDKMDASYASSSASADGGAGSIDFQSLLVAGPHSGTPFEIVGNIGVAVTVIVAMVFLLGRFARLRWWFAPLIAVGSMSLTVYVGHIVGVWFLIDHPSGSVPHDTGWKMLGGFILSALVFALVWKRFFKRGPLEYGMAAATKLAKFVK